MTCPSSDASSDTKEQPAHILVVEDNVMLRFTLTEWLRDLGYVVLEAASGDEAAILLGSLLTVDLVVTDIEMPGKLNGYDLAKHIDEKCPELPVILVSGNERNHKAGAHIFMRKPYDLMEITEHIIRLLSAAKKRDSA